MNIKKIFNNNKWAIFLMAFLIGGAIGIIIPLTSTYMLQRNVSDLTIGVIESVYFFAIAVGTVFINKKMFNMDLKKFIFIGLTLSSIGTLIFPLVSNPYYWFFTMCLIGFCISFHLVGTQTALHILSDEAIRGVVSGIYTLLFAAGYAVGTISGPIIYEKSIVGSFIVGAAFLIGAAFIVLSKINIKLMVNHKGINEKSNKGITVSLQGAFSYGFIENTIAALYPVFLIKSNFSVSQMGTALAMFVIGGIVGTIPITYLGDKIGREKSLVICSIISICSLVCITKFNAFEYKLLFSLICGIGVGAIYPVCMALGVEDLKKEDISRQASRFTFFYSFGSAAGPVLSSYIMNRFSNKYIFSISILFLIALLIRLIGINRLKLQN
ncbi:MFS transporter [Clostridium hydrogenum]|uniref:MFS transporter n=1 Tax=Clostridium hydrogenum TaxID=2855764 RepID=UPI001F2E48EB|nr:MFS transporter [Clostridium hydrogenum]